MRLLSASLDANVVISGSRVRTPQRVSRADERIINTISLAQSVEQTGFINQRDAGSNPAGDLSLGQTLNDTIRPLSSVGLEHQTFKGVVDTNTVI